MCGGPTPLPHRHSVSQCCVLCFLILVLFVSAGSKVSRRQGAVSGNAPSLFMRRFCFVLP